MVNEEFYLMKLKRKDIIEHLNATFPMFKFKSFKKDHMIYIYAESEMIDKAHEISMARNTYLSGWEAIIQLEVHECTDDTVYALEESARQRFPWFRNYKALDGFINLKIKEIREIVEKGV